MSDIGKLKFWCHKILPLVYDDSLSYYELLCKVVEKLNEVIEVMDPEGIKKQLNEIAKEYFNSNEFKEILLEAISEYVNRKVEYNPYLYINSKFSDEGFTPQGFCFYNNSIIIAFANVSTTETIYQKINAYNGNIEGELRGNYFHANSLCYSPKTNLLYSVNFYNSNEPSTPQTDPTKLSNVITIIDPSTMQFVKSVAIPELLNIGIVSVSYDNETMYLVSHHTNNNVYTFNEETNEIKYVCTISPGVNQCVEIHDNICYVINGNNKCVREHNINGALIGTYMLPYLSSDSLVPVGELEAIKFNGNTCFINSVVNKYTQTGTKYRHAILSMGYSLRDNTLAVTHRPSYNTGIYVKNQYAPYASGNALSPMDCVQTAVRIMNLAGGGIVTGENEKFDESIIIYDDARIYLTNLELNNISNFGKLYFTNSTVTGEGCETFRNIPNVTKLTGADESLIYNNQGAELTLVNVTIDANDFTAISNGGKVNPGSGVTVNTNKEYSVDNVAVCSSNIGLLVAKNSYLGSDSTNIANCVGRAGAGIRYILVGAWKLGDIVSAKGLKGIATGSLIIMWTTAGTAITVSIQQDPASVGLAGTGAAASGDGNNIVGCVANFDYQNETITISTLYARIVRNTGTVSYPQDNLTINRIIIM